MEDGSGGAVEKLLPVTEETPQFKNISIRNVNCKGALTGIYLQGLPEMKLENVQLENIQMEADYGMVCSDAKNIKVKNLIFKTKKTPVIDLKNSTEVTFDGLISQSTESPLILVSGVRTGSTLLKNVGITNPEKQLVIGNEVPVNVVQLMK